MALYGEIDVALDTFPYNGTATTCEALWMGVPVVTLAGSRHAARVGTSLLMGAGWPEWVAKTPEEYIETAKMVAKSRPSSQEVRAKFEASSVMDAKTVTATLEAAFRKIWDQRWCKTEN